MTEARRDNKHLNSSNNVKTRVITCLAAILSLAGCTDYRVSVNERTVYNPATLLDDVPVADSALRTCIEQTIIDQNIKQAEQLVELSCTNAGIKSLNGIEHFTALQHLNLEQNQLADIAPLSLLGQLTTLKLNDNQITNATPLRALDQLKQLNLAANPVQVCPSALALRPHIAPDLPADKATAALQLPSTCTANITP